MKKQIKNLLSSKLSRRGFLDASGKTATAAALTSGLSLPFSSIAQAAAPAKSEPEEQVKWSACLVNCGSRCPLKVHVKDDHIVRIDREDGGGDDNVFGEHQIRPCLRGRSNRYKTYNPDRLKYPMKRIGKRGEGKFKRISWDEATTIIADRLKHTIDTYGNEAVYYQYGSGSTGANLHGRSACKRLLNLTGGYLEQHNTYSTAQIGRVEPFIYGTPQGSYLAQIKHSDLVVMFCQNLAETRMSGGGQIQEIYRALEQSQAKVIIIDPRRTDSVVGLNAEWLPIRPGTDSALVAAICHTLVSENLADDAFINQYAVGWDESTLPASAEKNASYKSYILGLKDGEEKTAEWAASITGIPAKRIRQLARELVNAKAAWISQGWGIQRSANGEQASKAIMMLPVITKQFGRQGTNSGNWGYSSKYPVVGFDIKNPVKTSIPCFLWTKAIEEPENMTAKNSYVKGKDKLDVGIKFLWSYSSGVTMNQHSDLNKTHEILSDESKCEFILVWDHHMTSSARYADILLPDVSWLEAEDLINNSYATGPYHYLVRMQQTITPLWENRLNYDVLADIAKKLGIYDQFTEGRTLDQWIEHAYNETRKKRPNLPEFAKTDGMGIVDREVADIESHIALKEFREDPLKNKLTTPSGKIEIYSEQLAKLDQEWELPEGERITPIAEYMPVKEGFGDTETMKKYPLQMTGFHTKRRTHSTYHSVAVLREAVPDEVWMNPIDAQARGLKHGDMAVVFNKRGELLKPVKVTQRIMPGVVAMGEGAWRQTNKDGLDIGGCINTLTTQHPTALAKGNPQHTNLVEIRRA
ncbi:anaerobic dimethyl sulfoxide reductase subunit A [Vibrio xiamenensis]|uniref:Anaerobic dimethyl sulfoxide reductase subunit A n=1 Tax=Vibrio xiamenensis TaxID=861298 RepID=A0A1G8F3J8_9VIBR|nr:DMSO/selenate family reductase complex A subunit [Vibrio xiamenensis]SDH76657.1 anaerobic dimethyl sulfoxide reductase subunit A [Vibrio xiamenensis]